MISKCSTKLVSCQFKCNIFHILGDGAYSNVYKVKRLEDGKQYALKKVKLDHLSEKERENAINEVRILASVKHPNVI